MIASIRSATTADAARCAEIYRPYVTDSWVSFELDPPDTAEMAHRITAYSESHGWLVAEIEGQIAGYAYGARTAPAKPMQHHLMSQFMLMQLMRGGE